mmetsp:Transcript_7533/g.16853  ORF Transcript_7533/g.16853 Transcript_7533/m.16853 type:complete len:298 (-) Transcript_7533:364-1257(-)
MFSFELPSVEINCVLLWNSILPDDGNWHHIAVTSAGATFVDGVIADSNDVYSQSGSSCAGAAGSFSLANGQDGVANVNDAEQATGLHARYVAIHSIAWSAADTLARLAEPCRGVVSGPSLWGAWYGNSAVDRSGSGRVSATMAEATLGAPLSDSATGLSTIPDCIATPAPTSAPTSAPTPARVSPVSAPASAPTATPPPPSPSQPSPVGCREFCEYSSDDDCDDGGLGAEYSFCGLGTDCHDCGVRLFPSSPPSPSIPVAWDPSSETLPEAFLLNVRRSIHWCVQQRLTTRAEDHSA